MRSVTVAPHNGATDVMSSSPPWSRSRHLDRKVGRPPMRSKRLLIFLLATFGNFYAAAAQVADIAGVLPGDRWVYEVTDEITGDVKSTTTIVVLDVSESEINTRASTRGAAAPAPDRVRPRLEPHRRQRLEVQAVRRHRHPNASSGRQGVAFREQGHALSERHGDAAITRPIQSGGRGEDHHERRHVRHFKIETTTRQVNSNDQTKAATVMLRSGMRRASIAGFAKPISSRSRGACATRRRRS